MLITPVVIVPAENSEGIFNIGQSVGNRVHKASDDRLVYCRITGCFVWLPLVKLHCNGVATGLDSSILNFTQNRPNLALLMDVDHVMLPITFDVHADIEGDTPEIMHPEPLLHLILDLPIQAHGSNDKEIIHVQKGCGNGYVMIYIMEHEQSSSDTRCL